jgi:3-hydroxyisobutyrate dehydrogenase
MGLPMGRNLARAGMRVTAWNRTRDRALPLEADGAVVARSPAEAVAGADVIVQGTRQPAEQGRLVILASGPASAQGALEPVFGALGQRTLWLGDAGADRATSRPASPCATPRRTRG